MSDVSVGDLRLLFYIIVCSHVIQTHAMAELRN